LSSATERLVNDLQTKNADECINSTLAGIVIFEIALLLNASLPIEIKLQAKQFPLATRNSQKFHLQCELKSMGD